MPCCKSVFFVLTHQSKWHLSVITSTSAVFSHLVSTNSKEIIKFLHYRPFVRGGLPAMWFVFPFTLYCPNNAICWLRMRRECRERFPRHRGLAMTNMHHGTRVTHMPWCMPGSLTSGFLWSLWREKCSRHFRRMCTHNFTYLVRAPWNRQQGVKTHYEGPWRQCRMRHCMRIMLQPWNKRLYKSSGWDPLHTMLLTNRRQYVLHALIDYYWWILALLGANMIIDLKNSSLVLPRNLTFPRTRPLF